MTPGSINFSIVVADPCTTATINLNALASPVIPNTTPAYVIGATEDVQTFDFAKADFGLTSTCPTIEFKIVDADDVNKPEIHLSSATSGIFTFDSANSQLKTLTTDLSKAAVYNLEIQARFSGGSPAYSWGNTQNGAIVFTLTTHPCATDTLSIDSAVFATPALTYNLYNAAEDFTFTDAAAISSNSLTICGTRVWTVTNSDNTAVDSSVFTLDLVSASKKVTTQSSA